MNNPPLSKTATGFMILTALVAWAGLAIQQYVIINNIPGNGLTVAGAIALFLLFFTILTNLLVAICLTTILVGPASKEAQFFARPSTLAAITVYILLVGITYNIILRPLSNLQGLPRVCDEMLHVVVPILFTIFWLFFVPKGYLKWVNILYWLIFPGLYLVYALIRGHYSGVYAYPFINVTKLGYNQVAINSAGVMGVLIILGLLIVSIDKRMGRK